VRREPIVGVDLAGLGALVRAPQVLTGDLDEAARAALTAACGPEVEIVRPAAALRRAGHLAELAWERLAGGGDSDPAAVEPIYLN